MFGRKKQQADTTVEHHPKRGYTDLHNVIDETEAGAAYSIIAGNTAWHLPDGTGVIITVDTTAPINEGGLGGLTTNDARRDENKGLLLERIKADNIQVVETDDMLTYNVLGIIPTSQSLSVYGMGEILLFDTVTFGLIHVS